MQAAEPWKPHSKQSERRRSRNTPKQSRSRNTPKQTGRRRYAAEPWKGPFAVILPKIEAAAAHLRRGHEAPKPKTEAKRERRAASAVESIERVRMPYEENEKPPPPRRTGMNAYGYHAKMIGRRSRAAEQAKKGRRAAPKQDRHKTKPSEHMPPPRRKAWRRVYGLPNAPNRPRHEDRKHAAKNGE